MKISNQNYFLFSKISPLGERTAAPVTNPLKLKTLNRDEISFTGIGSVANKAADEVINLSKKTLSDLPQDLSNHRVFVRVDHNVPFEKDGTISDDTRIRATLNTIEELIKRKAKIVLATHIGDPNNIKKGQKEKEISTKVVAERLQELLNQKQGLENIKVIHTPKITGDDVIQQTHNLKPNEILYLENVRFNPAETGKVAVKNADGLYESVKVSPEEIDTYAKDLAKLGDIYVNDAFGAAHRDHVSTSKIAKYIPGAKVAGLLMQKEIDNLGQLLQNPERPFVAIIGGSKVSSKLEVLNTLVDKVDKLVIGGGMAHTFTLAKGGKIGQSLVELDQVDAAKAIIAKAKEKGVELILPVDTLIADKFADDALTKVVEVGHIPDTWQGLDIGPKSIEMVKSALGNAKTILWNGPVGVFEMPSFSKGTNSIAEAIADVTKNNKAKSILGGGDTLSAIAKSGIPEDSFSHISTGGGASLEMIEKNGKLPGILKLDNK